MDEEEGSRMVFFGQLREPELDIWSAPLLALKYEEQEQHSQEIVMGGKKLYLKWEKYLNTTNFCTV